MTQKITHVCQGTCSRQIDVELENGVVRSVSFTGGCHGNQQGIAALVRGMTAAEAVARLEGIDCRGKTARQLQPQDAEAFDLHLTADGVESHFRYEVAETPAGSRRLAWLNEAGGIDRYTFPLTEERRYEIERRRLLLEESGYTQTEAVGEERLRIGSAYEPAAVLDALARLAAAPAVWAVTEAGWTEIDVVSDSLRIERPGTLQRLSLEIRPRQRGGRL